MVGFKKVPSKGILLAFFISVFLILLLYVDISTDESKPEEKVEVTENLENVIDDLITYKIHQVTTGENLSIIFEDFKVPLNTAYRIFRLDKKNLLTNIKPGDRMRFTYLGDKIISIEISKDNLNSLLIEIGDEINIKNITKDIELISSYKSGIIKSSFYEAAQDAEIPDSIIMDFAYIFGWDIDFVFDIREGDSFFVVYETPYSRGEKIENGDIVAAKFINKEKKIDAVLVVGQEPKITDEAPSFANFYLKKPFRKTYELKQGDLEGYDYVLVYDNPNAFQMLADTGFVEINRFDHYPLEGIHLALFDPQKKEKLIKKFLLFERRE